MVRWWVSKVQDGENVINGMDRWMYELDNWDLGGTKKGRIIL